MHSVRSTAVERLLYEWRTLLRDNLSVSDPRLDLMERQTRFIRELEYEVYHRRVATREVRDWESLASPYGYADAADWMKTHCAVYGLTVVFDDQRTATVRGSDT